VPWFVNSLLEAGMIDHAMVPYSIIRGVWTGDWVVGPEFSAGAMIKE